MNKAELILKTLNDNYDYKDLANGSWRKCADLKLSEKLEGIDYREVQQTVFNYFGFSVPVEVSDYGISEEGNYSAKIYHFEDEDVFIRINGYVISHDGEYWESEPYIVRPVVKEVIFYQ